MKSIFAFFWSPCYHVAFPAMKTAEMQQESFMLYDAAQSIVFYLIQEIQYYSHFVKYFDTIQFQQDFYIYFTMHLKFLVESLKCFSKSMEKLINMFVHYILTKQVTRHSTATVYIYT